MALLAGGFDDDDAAASVLEEDWAPPAELIRHLARKTASAAKEAAKEAKKTKDGPAQGQAPTVEDLSRFGAKPGGGPDQPTGAHVRLKLDSDSMQPGEHNETMATTLPSGALSTTKSTFLDTGELAEEEGSPSPNRHEMDTTVRFQDTPGSSPGKSASPKKKGPLTWSDCHDVPWDSSVFRPNAWGLYQQATPKVCCCLRAFEPGQNRCVKCGTRRPVPAPDGVLKAVKEIHAQDPHKQYPEMSIFERNYMWSAVYDDKKYKLALAAYNDEQDYIDQNGHFVPQLSERSVEIAESLQMKPLHERTEEILYKRNEYLSMRRQQVYEAQLCKECTFCPRLHPKSVGMHGRDRKSLYKWDHKRAHSLDVKIAKVLQTEAESCPFTPELSAASRRIAEEYSATNVHERLLADMRRRRVDQHEENMVQASLGPADFAEEETPRKVKTPINKERPKSARSNVFGPGSPWAQTPRASSSSPSPKASYKRNDASRASVQVLPNGLAGLAPVGDGKSVRERKANKPAQTASSGSAATGATRRTSRRGPRKQNAEEKAQPVPKSALSTGKNTVVFQSTFADLVHKVHSGSIHDEHY